MDYQWLSDDERALADLHAQGTTIYRLLYRLATERETVAELEHELAELRPLIKDRA
jgi:hypothetical protein